MVSGALPASFREGWYESMKTASRSPCFIRCRKVNDLFFDQNPGKANKGTPKAKWSHSLNNKNQNLEALFDSAILGKMIISWWEYVSLIKLNLFHKCILATSFPVFFQETILSMHHSSHTTDIPSTKDDDTWSNLSLGVITCRRQTLTAFLPSFLLKSFSAFLRRYSTLCFGVFLLAVSKGKVYIWSSTMRCCRHRRWQGEDLANHRWTIDELCECIPPYY